MQDAGTGPELEAWAAKNSRLKLFIEKDEGMYDAVNRGLRRATGDILAYLNCDEQYLPGALVPVAEFFDENPRIDALFAHAIIVNAKGEFVAYRKAVRPGKYHPWVSKNLAILTCATFFRRRILDEYDLFFSADLKDVGDADWIIRMGDKPIRTGVLPIFTSAFTDTGQNRNLGPTGTREKAELVASAPLWARLLREPIIAFYRLRRLLAGAYSQKPFSYSIYTLRDPARRSVFQVSHPTSRWRR